MGFKRRQLKVGANEAMGELMKYCRHAISPERLTGFMMAPWAACDNEQNFEKNLRGIEIFGKEMA